jgi:TonB-dependent receptor
MFFGRSWCIFLSLILFITRSGYGQSQQEMGRLSGKIYNEKNEILSAATIKVDNTNKQRSSDVNGEFELLLAPGIYSLTVSYSGMAPKKITGVEVKKGEITRQDIILEMAAKMENEVIVTASARKESVSSLYKIQKNNMAVSDGISIEQIRRTPDNNVGQSLKRINGVTVLENKFVVIRGMGERYNNVLLNGSQLPSTEANRKNFSFDLLPSNLIDNIVVNKTATPDLTAEFAGGIVQVTTKEVPEKNTFSVSIGSGGNTNSTFKDFISTKIDKKEYFGKFSSDRKWYLAAWNPVDYYLARTNEKSLSDAYAINARIPNTYGLNKYTAMPVQDYQVNVGLRKRFKNNASGGIILAGSYRNEQLIEDYLRSTEFGDSVGGRKYGFTTSLGGILSMAYTVNRNKFSFKNVVSSRLTHDTYVFSGKDANANATNNYGSFLNQNILLQSRLEGEHALTTSGLRVKWYVDRSTTDRDQPDTRTTKYFVQTGGKPSIDIISPLNPGLGGLYSAQLKEKRYGWGGDIQMPFRLFDQSQKIKAGYSGFERTSDFTSVFLRPTLTNASSSNAEEYFGLPDYELFTQENFRKGIFVMNPVTTQDGLDADTYTGKQQLHAGYLMGDILLPFRIRIIGGVRMENYNIAVNTVIDRDSVGKVSRDTSYGLKETKFFPSANIVYELNKRMNIRFAYSITTARFDFREAANIAYYDFFLPGVIFGNPGLKNTTIKNYDLRYEFYPSGDEIITASLFYKYFKDPIEVLQTPNASSIYTYYNFNQVASSNKGFEMDVRKSFAFINRNSGFLKNLYISANFSYMKSDVTIDKKAIGKLFAGLIGAPSIDTAVNDSRDRALQGLSPYSINGGLLYQGKNVGFNIVYNRFGRRLVFAGIEPQFDYYENPRDVIDVQVYGKLLKQKMEIKLNVSDILNQSFITYNNSSFMLARIGTPNNDPKGDAYNKSQDYVLYKAKRGTGINLSLSYKF